MQQLSQQCTQNVLTHREIPVRMESVLEAKKLCSAMVESSAALFRRNAKIINFQNSVIWGGRDLFFPIFVLIEIAW